VSLKYASFRSILSLGYFELLAWRVLHLPESRGGSTGDPLREESLGEREGVHPRDHERTLAVLPGGRVYQGDVCCDRRREVWSWGDAGQGHFQAEGRRLRRAAPPQRAPFVACATPRTYNRTSSLTIASLRRVFLHRASARQGLHGVWRENCVKQTQMPRRTQCTELPTPVHPPTRSTSL
jgi:hypothetical protein